MDMGNVVKKEQLRVGLQDAEQRFANIVYRDSRWEILRESTRFILGAGGHTRVLRHTRCTRTRVQSYAGTEALTQTFTKHSPCYL